jgi:antitoxin FitA
MPTAITLKNIPDDLYERLKATARARHRSVNKEVIACLERTYLPTKIDVEQRLARIRELRASLKGRKFNHHEIDRAINWGRS